MRIKMVDIARHLGVSKATVSLAVNGKPGVNEETRRKVLECLEEMKKNGGKISEAQIKKTSTEKTAKQMIKVVIINHRKQVVCDPELDLWSEVFSVFDSEAKRLGYLYSLTYLNEDEAEIETVIAECNMDLVAGIVLFGTELVSEDYRIIERIKKPVVLYDCEVPEGRYNSVCIDNEGAVKSALKLLYGAGAKDVKYLCTGKDIYNFRKRKEAFQNTLIGKAHLPEKDDIVELGNKIPKITEHMMEWLENHKLPDGFLFENYQVSIGVVTALKKCGIQVPNQIKLVGIDEIPEYILADIRLTQIKVPHAERAAMAMDILDKEIKNILNIKVKVLAESEVILKNSL